MQKTTGFNQTFNRISYNMKKRKITDIYKVDFLPFDRYGPVVPKMSWHKISFDEKTGFGSFIIKMDPGARSTPHTHIGYEEFLVIEGELMDADNTVFKKGDFVTFEPGSKHSSYTEKGALLMVFQRGINKPIK